VAESRGDLARSVAGDSIGPDPDHFGRRRRFRCHARHL